MTYFKTSLLMYLTFLFLILTQETIAESKCHWTRNTCQESCGLRRKAVLAYYSADSCPKCYCPKYKCEEECASRCEFSGKIGTEAIDGIALNWKPCDACACECLSETNLPEQCKVKNCDTYERNSESNCLVCGKCKTYKNCENQCHECSAGMDVKRDEFGCSDNCECECLTSEKAMENCRKYDSQALKHCSVLEKNASTGCYTCNCKNDTATSACKKLGTCLLSCKMGFQQDSLGCKLCECIEENTCPSIQNCNSDCEIQKSSDGCPKCICTRTAKELLQSLLEEMKRIFNVIDNENDRNNINVKEKSSKSSKTSTSPQQQKDSKHTDTKTQGDCPITRMANCKEDCDEMGFWTDQNGCNVCRCKKHRNEKCNCFCTTQSTTDSCACECVTSTSRGTTRSKETFSESTKIEEFTAHG